METVLNWRVNGKKRHLKTAIQEIFCLVQSDHRGRMLHDHLIAVITTTTYYPQSTMNTLNAWFLLFSILCAKVVVARELGSSYTTKTSKKMSKKTKSPSDTKGSKLSTKSPTLKSSKSSKKAGVALVGIPTLNFDQFGEDEDVLEFGGLQATGLKASQTNPPAPGGKAGTPKANTVTFTAPGGATFSLVSASMAAAADARPVTVRGFNAGGVEIVSEVFDLTNFYKTYDLSAFADVSEVSFTFPGPSPANAGIDSIDFV
eukprot:scaffold7015_cov88-Cylindrotheca_fusiformis.AAC.2